MPVGPVSPEDEIARFVFQASSLRANNTIKPNAFYPNAFGRCSVLVSTGMSDADVLAYAQTNIVPQRGMAVVAWGTLAASVPLNDGLQVVYAEPPQKHANVQGYANAREKMMEQATLMAKNATLKRP